MTSKQLEHAARFENRYFDCYKVTVVAKQCCTCEAKPPGTNPVKPRINKTSQTSIEGR